MSTEDKIAADAQRAISPCAGSTVVDAEGSHAVYVADLIAKAANAMVLATL